MQIRNPADFLDFLALLHLHNMRDKQQSNKKLLLDQGFSGKASNKKRFKLSWKCKCE